MLKIWPYRPYSKSARVLARMLNVKRIVSPDYCVKRRDVIINWGKTTAATVLGMLNKPEAVRNAADKRTALTLMMGQVTIPEFTMVPEAAKVWLEQGRRVVARRLVNSHSGNGAVVMETLQDFVQAPLYTKYVRRDAEYRVHVFNGQVIDYVRKKRRNGYGDSPIHNDYIRTHQFGWVFCRDGIELPEQVKLQAIKAVSVLGLDFGAVDVLWRERGTVATVLEVNTAPGLEGTTVNKYAEAIRNYYTYNRSANLRS